MTEKELKDWFFEKLSNCYSVIFNRYPDNIIYYYDEKFIRKCKLSRINNIEIEQPTKPGGKCLFDQDLTSKCLWCDYDEIWSFFEREYVSEHDKIAELISSWLKDDFTLGEYKVNLQSIRIKNRMMNSYLLDSYKIEMMVGL